MTSKLRIFTYLPNPRIFKATIAARLCDVELDLRGAPVEDLPHWLWDFDAKPLSEEERERAAELHGRRGRTGFGGQLLKTDEFLQTHPFGTVPAAFSPEGDVGVFESNSIMRAVARLGADTRDLYGDRDDPYIASRVDSFLDAALVLSRDTQHYMLALRGERLSKELHEKAKSALDGFVTGAERALGAGHAFLVGDDLTLADICFVAEIASLMRESRYVQQLELLGCSAILTGALWRAYPNARAHFEHLCEHSAFAPDLEPYLADLRG